jgi:hypothetical protein
MSCDGRSGKSNEERGGVLRRRTSFAKAFFNKTIEVGSNTKATATDGEVHPGQTVVVTGTAESDVVHLLRIVGCEKRVKRSFDCGFGNIN